MGHLRVQELALAKPYLVITRLSYQSSSQSQDHSAPSVYLAISRSQSLLSTGSHGELVKIPISSAPEILIQQVWGGAMNLYL